MKNWIITGFLLLAFAGANGQNRNSAENAEKLTERMAAKLELNDNQKGQVLEINKAHLAKLKSVREKQEKNTEELKAIKTTYQAEMRKVLNDEQYQNFLEMAEKRREKIRERRQNNATSPKTYQED